MVSCLWSSPNLSDAPAALKYLNALNLRPYAEWYQLRIFSNINFDSPYELMGFEYAFHQ